MAYTAVVSPLQINGNFRPRMVRVTILETEARDTSEFSITGLPPYGTIVLYKATLSSGTGTAIQPKIGRAEGFSTTSLDLVGTQESASSYINDAAPLYFVSPTGTLYIRSSPNSSVADHTIRTEIVIRFGF